MRNVFFTLGDELGSWSVGLEKLMEVRYPLIFMWRTGIVSKFHGIYDAPAKPLFG